MCSSQQSDITRQGQAPSRIHAYVKQLLPPEHQQHQRLLLVLELLAAAQHKAKQSATAVSQYTYLHCLGEPRLRTPALIGPVQLHGRRGLSVTIRYRPPSLLCHAIHVHRSRRAHGVSGRA